METGILAKVKKGLSQYDTLAAGGGIAPNTRVRVEEILENPTMARVHCLADKGLQAVRTTTLPLWALEPI